MIHKTSIVIISLRNSHFVIISSALFSLSLFIGLLNLNNSNNNKKNHPIFKRLHLYFRSIKDVQNLFKAKMLHSF